MSEDIFEAALSVEDSLYSDAYKRGFEDGDLAGRLEGRSFGMTNGFEKFLEAGKLHGKSSIWASRLPPGLCDTPVDGPNTSDSQGKSDGAPSQDAQSKSLPRLPNNARLAKNIESIQALMELDTLPTQNDDEAVQDFDDRLKKAQGKAKVVERLIAGKQAAENEDRAA